jgi:hypothetical protein
MLDGSWRYVTRVDLVKDDMPYEAGESICKRVAVKQSLYAGAPASA